LILKYVGWFLANGEKQFQKPALVAELVTEDLPVGADGYFEDVEVPAVEKAGAQFSTPTGKNEREETEDFGIQYKQLPRSYRWSQSMMLASVIAIIAARQVLFMPNQQGQALVQITGWSLMFGMSAFAVIVCCYVVLRYPYISLVATSNDDLFTKQWTSSKISALAKLVFPLGLLIFCIMCTHAMLVAERLEFARIAATYYCYVQFAFTVFVCFRYNPITHPTVSTYIRATLGIGLLYIPITFPVLIIGSIRCKRILGLAADDQDHA